MIMITVAMTMVIMGAEALQQASHSKIANGIGASAVETPEDQKAKCIQQADAQVPRIKAFIEKQVDADTKWLDWGRKCVQAINDAVANGTITDPVVPMLTNIISKSIDDEEKAVRAKAKNDNSSVDDTAIVDRSKCDELYEAQLLAQTEILLAIKTELIKQGETYSMQADTTYIGKDFDYEAAKSVLSSKGTPAPFLDCEGFDLSAKPAHEHVDFCVAEKADRDKKINDATSAEVDCNSGTTSACSTVPEKKTARDMAVQTYDTCLDQTVPCEGATCSMFEDPHLVPFDGAQVSLLTTHSTSTNDFTTGDKWVVKNQHVKIQARYVEDAERTERALFVAAIAVSGAFVDDNVLTIGSLDDPIMWNGQQLVESENEHYVIKLGGDNFGVKLTRSEHSSLVTDLSQENTGIDIELPMNVRLIVNRLHGHVNFAVKMCQQLGGGQEGLCGNFNGIAADDSMEFLSNRNGIDVPPQDSLFKSIS